MPTRTRKKAAPADEPQLALVGSSVTQHLPFARIVPDPEQPRQVFDEDALIELADSIAEIGLLEPLLVRYAPNPHAEDDADRDWWVIVSGERRFRALGILHTRGHEIGDIACTLSEHNDEQRAIAQILENLLRVDLDPYEEACAFTRLVHEHGLQQNELARKVHRSESYVSDRLGLFGLPDEAITMLRNGTLSLTVAKEIARIDDPTLQAAVIKRKPVHDYQVTSYVREQKMKQGRKDLIAALKAAGYPIEDSRPPQGWKVRYVFKSADELAGTLPEKPVKGAVAYVPAFQSWSENEARIAVPLTEKQLTAEQERAAKEQAKRDEELRKEREARREQALSKLSPEKRAWIEEKDRLEAEHEANVQAYRENVMLSRQLLAGEIQAKQAARWAMLFMVGEAARNPHQLARALGLDASGDWEAVGQRVKDFASESAAKLTITCAMYSMLSGYQGGEVPEALALFEERLASEGVVEPVLVLPPDPEAPEGEEHLDPEDEYYDEEQAAMEDVRRQLDNDDEPESMIDTPDIAEYVDPHAAAHAVVEAYDPDADEPETHDDEFYDEDVQNGIVYEGTEPAYA